MLSARVSCLARTPSCPQDFVGDHLRSQWITLFTLTFPLALTSSFLINVSLLLNLCVLAQDSWVLALGVGDQWGLIVKRWGWGLRARMLVFFPTWKTLHLSLDCPPWPL